MKEESKKGLDGVRHEPSSTLNPGGVCKNFSKDLTYEKEVKEGMMLWCVCV